MIYHTRSNIFGTQFVFYLSMNRNLIFLIALLGLFQEICAQYYIALTSDVGDLAHIEAFGVLKNSPQTILLENTNEKYLDSLKKNGFLLEKVTQVEIRNQPNDLLFSDQWSIQHIQADLLWDITTGGISHNDREIVIAVVDRGFDIDHDDLNKNFWKNQYEINGDGIDNDENGYVDDYFGYNIYSENDQHLKHFHGTGVAGIIGASGNNEIGIAGINWNIKIMPLSTTNPNGILTSELYAMYDYIIGAKKEYLESNGSRGANVVAVNASLGVTGANPDDFPIWCNYMDQFGQVGILYVASTTNENWDVDRNYDMPVSCISPYIISVTNSDMNDRKVSNAGYGQYSVDLAAPGESIFTTRVQNQYGNFSGTSASSPHVSGVIGLLYSYPCEKFTQSIALDNSGTALLIKDAILQSSTTNQNLKAQTRSGGRLNAYQAYQQLDQYFCGETSAANQLKLYPTLATNELNVVYTHESDLPIEIGIYNLQGQRLYFQHKESISNKHVILLDPIILVSGIYLLSIESAEGVTTEKFTFLKR